MDKLTTAYAELADELEKLSKLAQAQEATILQLRASFSNEHETLIKTEADLASTKVFFSKTEALLNQTKNDLKEQIKLR